MSIESSAKERGCTTLPYACSKNPQVQAPREVFSYIWISKRLDSETKKSHSRTEKFGKVLPSEQNVQM